jgi:hypothetical protein
MTDILWVTIPSSLCGTFVCIAMFSKANRKQISLIVNAEVKAIIDQNANKEDGVLYRWIWHM